MLNCHYIDFPASYKDYAIFEKLNEDIALNVLYVPFNQRTICSEYISNRNYSSKKQITLLKITDNKEKWHFLALPSIPREDGYLRPIKSFSRLMEGISSKNHDDFYCYGCFHSFRTESALKKHTELCENNRFCEVKLPKQGKNFKYDKSGTKALKMNYVIYADLEALLKPYHTCDNEYIITKEINKHEACGYSINVVNNHIKETQQTCCRGKDSLTKFCKELREIGRTLFDTEMKPTKALNKKQQSDYDKAKYCYICKKQFTTHRNYLKVRDCDHYTGNYRGVAHSLCNLRYSTQVDIPVAFHNGSNYDFNLIITEFAKEFRSEMRCVPLNTDKYMCFSIPLRKEIKYNKYVTYNLKFIDSKRFMDDSLSNLVDNLSGLYECKCLNKKDQHIKIKCKEQKVVIHKNIIENNKEKQIHENKINKIVYTRCKSCNTKNKQL